MLRTASLLTTTVVLAASVTTLSTDADARGYERTYRVSLVNITSGSQLTPVLAAVHRPSVALFTLGEPALHELGILAETGDTAPLAGLLDSLDAVSSQLTVAGPSSGLTFAGERLEFEITASPFDVLSLASMILPTNDSFVALNSVRLPFYGTLTYTALGYDSGTEDNDERCVNIPGPTCGEDGEGSEGEGFVHVSGGIHGIGDLPEDIYDWRNPTASVSITRIR